MGFKLEPNLPQIGLKLVSNRLQIAPKSRSPTLQDPPGEGGPRGYLGSILGTISGSFFEIFGAQRTTSRQKVQHAISIEHALVLYTS